MIEVLLTVERTVSGSQPVQAPASSAHPGGLNVVFGDGSVRTIQYGIDRVIWNALGHREDGISVTIP